MQYGLFSSCFCRVIFRVSKIFLKFLSYYFNKIHYKTSVNYKLKSRFASFQNVPELLSMYRSFADVVTKRSWPAGQRIRTKALYSPSRMASHITMLWALPQQAEYMEQIIERMENLPPDPRVDNPLKITNDARKAGLDFPLD